MKVVLAKAASDLLAAGLEPQAAAEKVVVILRERTGGAGGLIVVDPRGRLGAAFSTPHMAYAFCTSDSPEPTVRI